MKKSITTIFAMIAVAISTSAGANLQGTLDSMFQSNVTSPGAYNSTKRSGFVGGGISVRAPVRPINLTSFDPPRYSAGCGGIDMYGGSFSFINKNQFTALLRNIMSNAIGLLFQAALQNISPSMSSLLNSFQKMIQDMNALASNTCAIAHQLVDKKDPAAKETAMGQAMARVGTSMATFSDHFGGTAPESTADAKAKEQATEANNPSAGNYTWRALHRSQVADSLGVAGTVSTDPNGDKLFLLSLIGTDVDTAYQGGSHASDASQHVSFPPSIHLLDLLTGDRLESYTCTGAAVGGDADAFGPHSCIGMALQPFDFAGSIIYVRYMLYGGSGATTGAAMRAAVEAADAGTPHADSIYGRLLNCSGNNCSLTVQQQKFISMAGPVFHIIMNGQYDPARLPVLTDYIVAPLAIQVTKSMGMAAVRAAKLAWKDVADVKMPEFVGDNVGDINAQLSVLTTMETEYQDNLEKAMLAVEEIRKGLPAYNQ